MAPVASRSLPGNKDNYLSLVSTKACREPAACGESETQIDQE